MKENNCYIAIDLKSFYASVECVDRGLNPLATHLVVADESRTDKTICLAVTPSLKAYGIAGRGRLYEVKQRVKEINDQRCCLAAGHSLTGSSFLEQELRSNKNLALDFIIAPPRMARYIEYSKGIYEIYLKYVAQEDMLVYSIDEVFIDARRYLTAYRLTPRELAGRMVEDVFKNTGITATAGIGSNLFLCKVAMDITAKHSQPNRFGLRIAELNEDSFRETMWKHQPLTDFWRIGKGTAKKLVQHGMYTLGDVAKQSHEDEGLLYRLFGKNAQLLIDHAWGYESCTMADIKAYKPKNKSLSTGQILPTPYEADKAKLVIKEMAYALALDMVEKGLVCKQVVLYIGYDVENLLDPVRKEGYKGAVTTDSYGRKLPYHSVGTGNLDKHTASAKKLLSSVCRLFDSIVNKNLLIRRMSLNATQILYEEEIQDKTKGVAQLDLFSEYEAVQACHAKEKIYEERERRMQQTVLEIKNRYGKNSILRGMNLQEGATAKVRNESIGGHRA